MAFGAVLLTLWTAPVLAFWLDLPLRLVGGLTLVAMLFLAPYSTWKGLSGEMRAEDWRILFWIAAAAGLALVAKPNVEWSGYYRVYGVVGRYEHSKATASFEHYSMKDAVARAKEVWGERTKWARDEEGRFVEADVKIHVYREVEAMDSINRLLGTRYGRESYETSLRFLESGED